MVQLEGTQHMALYSPADLFGYGLVCPRTTNHEESPKPRAGPEHLSQLKGEQNLMHTKPSPSKKVHSTTSKTKHAHSLALGQALVAEHREDDVRNVNRVKFRVNFKKGKLTYEVGEQPRDIPHRRLYGCSCEAVCQDSQLIPTAHSSERHYGIRCGICKLAFDRANFFDLSLERRREYLEGGYSHLEDCGIFRLEYLADSKTRRSRRHTRGAWAAQMLKLTRVMKDLPVIEEADEC